MSGFISAARILQPSLGQVAGTFSTAGWIIAALKLFVFLPTLLLLPFSRWRILARAYAAEIIAALVVLFTFSPAAFLQRFGLGTDKVLGKLVFACSTLFVHGLTYTGALTPTVHGPDLDVTILLACAQVSAASSSLIIYSHS